MRIIVKNILRNAKYITVLLLALIIDATTYYPDLQDQITRFPIFYSFSFLTILATILLPVKFIWLNIPFALLITAIVDHLNEAKISILALPISFDDIEILISNPSLFLDVTGLKDLKWDRNLILGLSFVSVTFLIITYKILIKKQEKKSTRKPLFNTVKELASILILTIIAKDTLTSYAEYIKFNLPAKHAKLLQELHLPESQVTLSRILGVIEYISYTSIISHENLTPDTPDGIEKINTHQILNSTSKYVRLNHNKDKLLPNIVLIHAESTFDPNHAFELASPIELPLWSKIEGTQALTPLRVNIIGGGSWVTDFEVFSGLDSRTFGFQGFYAPYYIAPMMKYSFAKYLQNKGYKTKGFYTVRGDSYNTKNAFAYYGFDEFYDGPSLGMTPHWDRFLDKDFATAIVKMGAFNSDQAQPFMYYIETLENHGPHPCKNFFYGAEFETIFKNTEDFDINCQLNEYVKRAKSTSEAFTLILEKLRKIELETGRPYVLVAYGDHQPWDFTNGVYSIGGGKTSEKGFHDFKKVRSDASQYDAIFHLVASEDNILKDFSKITPPASTIPTIVSAFVANRRNDLYFPENFYLMRMCGENFNKVSCPVYNGISSRLKKKILGINY